MICVFIHMYTLHALCFLLPFWSTAQKGFSVYEVDIIRKGTDPIFSIISSIFESILEKAMDVRVKLPRFKGDKRRNVPKP